MSASDFETVLAAVLVDRRLLDHPFYRRWERGEVTMNELAAYAAQYRHFETYLPTFLERLADALPEGPARDLVAANLADELGDPVPHVDLFEGFAGAVGARSEAPTRATSQLIETYEQLLCEGGPAALAGFVSYESQSSEIASRKADGLRLHHGLDDDAVAFWEHHADVDVRHGAWAQLAMEQCTEHPQALSPSARRAADAWWTFLDEREALARAC